MSKLLMIEPSEMAPSLAGNVLQIKADKDIVVAEGLNVIKLKFDIQFKGSPTIEFLVSLSSFLLDRGIMLGGHKIEKENITLYLVNHKKQITLQEQLVLAEVKMVELAVYRQATKPANKTHLGQALIQSLEDAKAYENGEKELKTTEREIASPENTPENTQEEKPVKKRKPRKKKTDQ
jgi:hypothetical protein